MTIGAVYDEAVSGVLAEIKASVARLEKQIGPARESMHAETVRDLVDIRDALRKLADKPLLQCFPDTFRGRE